MRASAFRSVVRLDGKDGDHRQRAADPRHQCDHGNMRKKCQGETSESESDVQDRKQNQAPESLECAAMGAKFRGDYISHCNIS
jgi:hypothetical protein